MGERIGVADAEWSLSGSLLPSGMTVTVTKSTKLAPATLPPRSPLTPGAG